MKALKRAVFLACVVEVAIIFTFGPLRIAYAAVPVEISADTIWRSDGGPYALDGDVRVLPGVTLSIGQGVRITGQGKLRLDHASLKSEGAILYGGPTIYAFDSNVNLLSTTIYAGDGDAVRMEGGRLDANSSRFERNSGAGVYLKDSPDSSVTAGIYGSVFKENGVALSSKTWVPAEAQNDWWGQYGGPSWSGPNRVEGKLFYIPYLSEEPDKVCCSSVLFIPGIEGTRLYDGQMLVWEPLGAWALSSLLMDPSGMSLLPISVGDVIGRAYGIGDVYSSFLGFLDGLVASSTVSQARPYPYDWRMPADSIAGQVLEETVRSMASTSKTGKVIIVAHSNGGLVAKALVKRLEGKGAAGLIDRVISVASPFVGTPESVFDMLDGDSPALFGVPLFSLDLAKKLIRNMPSVYGLLPSAVYAYSTSSSLVVGKAEVNDHSGLTDFLSSRSNTGLLSAADALHETLDQFAWPREISASALAGWNVLTTSGVRYFYRLSCSFKMLKKICKPTEAHEPVLTEKGDGTVVFSSASFGSDQVGSLDLDAISKKEGRSFDHSNIMESKTVQEAILDLILDKPLSSVVSDGFLFSGGPEEDRGYTQVSVSGDADLNVYDASNAPIGRKRLAHDEAGTSTYVYIPPAASSGRYSAVMTGTGLGYASLNITNAGTQADEAVSYEQVPLLPGSVASTTFDGSLEDPQPINVDLNHDGIADLTGSTTENTTGGGTSATSTEENIATTTLEALKEALCK